MLNTTSLSATLDGVSQAFFFREAIIPSDASSTAAWIASRQGKPICYGEMFGLFEDEYRSGVRLFTGELLPRSASARHVMGEEAVRALLLLNDSSTEVQAAQSLAVDWMESRLIEYPEPGRF